MLLKSKSLLTMIFITMQVTAFYAQPVDKIKLPQEKVILTTDRTLYFAGEQLGLRADCLLPSIADSLSRVMYVELLDKKSKPVIQKKLQISNGISKAILQIPTEIVTGNYYIRAYTQYMRNFDKSLFYTTELTIINPDLPAKDIIQTVVKDSIVAESKRKDKPVEISLSSLVFQANSLITVGLTGSKELDVSVSVIKKGSYEERATEVNKYFRAAKDSASGLKWFPEIRSISISGKLVDKQTQQPLKNVMVYASIIDSSKQFHAAKTNEEGAFVFSLINLHDDHQVYIGSDEDATILVNPDFAAGLPSADFVTLKIDSARLNLINEMYINEQVTSVYNDEQETIKAYPDTLPDPFRTSMETVYFKDYVALPTMTDMFNEIVPYTKVKNRKGKSNIQLADKKDKTFFEHTLILLDNIPFHDHTALLSLPPSKINSVGVIPRPYVYGGQVINGVISIKSKDGNLAGLKLPEDIVAVDYIIYQPEERLIYTLENKFSSAKPGFKNTLYWNPAVALKDGKQQIQFYSSGYLSDYDIVVKGIDKKGNTFTETKSITITNKINR